MLTVYVGFDSREEEALRVCVYSLRKNSAGVPVVVLDRSELVRSGLYGRPLNEPASTEFAFTRFYVPLIHGPTGYALFCDCDFLFTADVRQLVDCLPPAKAVALVQHDYVPRRAVKMDGQPQVAYPRKNWSSLMLWNCQHPVCRSLTPAGLDAMSAPDLHRFVWCPDSGLATLPLSWNWLEGEYPVPSTPPAGIHWTNGGPWFPGCQNVAFSDLYRQYLRESEDLPGPLISEAHRAQNVELHRRTPAYGTSVAPYFPMVQELCDRFGARTVLDYGSGKQLLASYARGHWPQLKITSYDPAIPGFDTLPGMHDIVVCTDVLEHVEPVFLDHVLSHIASVTGRSAFFSISLRAAKKLLPNGRNAHLIVESPDWWLRRLSSRFHIPRHGKATHDDALWCEGTPITAPIDSKRTAVKSLVGPA